MIPPQYETHGTIYLQFTNSNEINSTNKQLMLSNILYIYCQVTWTLMKSQLFKLHFALLKLIIFEINRTEICLNTSDSLSVESHLDPLRLFYAVNVQRDFMKDKLSGIIYNKKNKIKKNPTPLMVINLIHNGHRSSWFNLFFGQRAEWI